MKEVDELRNAYNSISSSYQSKKDHPWKEIKEELNFLRNSKEGVLIDLGGGNGRNLIHLDKTLIICFDLSFSLLQNSITPMNNQRVAGSTTDLPFRNQSVNFTMSLAVLHHLPTHNYRLLMLKEIRRITSPNSSNILTVWRKWRPDWRKKIIHYIRNSLPIDDLIDHQRPWKESTGNVISYRFYHYYTWKELFLQLLEADFVIKERKILGGKSNRDNFLVKFSH